MLSIMLANYLLLMHSLTELPWANWCVSACTKLCMAMRWVKVPLVPGLVMAVMSLLAEHCWADGGGPNLAERVIWAVNAGGEAHTDMHGIHFKKDPLEGKLGKGECLGMAESPFPY